MEKLEIAIVFLILSTLYLPATVFAEMLGDIPGTNYNFFKLVFGPDLTEEYLKTESVLQYLFFPFLAVVMIMYGILSDLRIFRRGSGINAALAIIIAIIASSTGGLLTLVRWMIGIAGGTLGTFMFGLLLLGGIILWALARFWDFGLRREGGAYERIVGAARESFSYQNQEQRIRDVMRRLEAMDPYPYKEIKELHEKLNALEKERIKKVTLAAEDAKKEAERAA